VPDANPWSPAGPPVIFLPTNPEKPISIPTRISISVSAKDPRSRFLLFVVPPPGPPPRTAGARNATLAGPMASAGGKKNPPHAPPVPPFVFGARPTAPRPNPKAFPPKIDICLPEGFLGPGWKFRGRKWSQPATRVVFFHEKQNSPPPLAIGGGPRPPPSCYKVFFFPSSFPLQLFFALRRPPALF